MAKKKLTIEEKLQAALVPAEEQPYKVPENWCWVRLGSISTNQYGYSAKAIYDSNYPRMLRITDIKEDGVDWKSVPNCVIDDETKEKYLLQTDDIVVARTGATTGKSYLLVNPDNAVFASYLIRLRITREVLPSYIYLFLQSSLYWNQITDLAAGIAQPGVNSSKLLTLMVPLPEKGEQSRIVARIESLFAKLDEAKEKIQEVLDGADLRRAAILHQAFTGKLTEKWRRENGVSDDSRETSNVKSICNSLKYGTAKKSVQDGDVAVLRMGNLQNGEIDWGSLVYSNDQDDIEKYSLKDGDVLFNRTNSAELVGKTSIYRGERPAIYAGYLIKLDYKRDKIIGDFFNYMLNSPKAKEYCNKVKTDGVNQSNINAKKIGAFEFDVPTILEQQEIVRLLDNLLSREQSTVTACEEALTTIDTLKKSILARAFRGELGTNDPSDPSAKELLREILSA